MNFKEKQIEISKLKLNYIDTGRGKTILFLHGAYISTKSYKRNIELLSKKYRVISPDIPCFGKSDMPDELWNYKNYSDYFKKFMNSLNLKKVIIIGHSFGGGIALNLAQDKKIEKIILINPAAYFPKRTILKSYYLLFIKKTFNDAVTYKKPIQTFHIICDGLNQLLKSPLKLQRMVRIVNNCVLTNNPDYKKIRCPTLILWGEKDEIFPIKDAKTLAKNIEQSELKYIKGNHEWCILNPEEFSSQIDKFIQKNR